MRHALRALLLSAFAALSAEAAPWQPPAGGTEVPLWPASLALPRPEVTGPERVERSGSLAGRPVTSVENVTRPTMTIFPAKGRPNGTAVLVFPGGGYRILAIDLEGTEVCDWITVRGVTCIVLKYRVPQTWHPAVGPQRPPTPQMSLQDAQRAMGLLRARAGELHIDPHRIGVLGFSAGGHMVEQISNAATRAYPAVDAADRQSARPDFAVALYPGHLWSGHAMDLYPFDPVRADAPPTFLLQAQDDDVDEVRDSVSYFLALNAADVPTELHVYPHGHHGFGLRPTAEPITRWPALVQAWLRNLHMLPPS